MEINKNQSTSSVSSPRQNDIKAMGRGLKIMNLKFDQKNIDHIARHLWGASELGGKFNSKIADPNDFLTKLTQWLAPRINADDLSWIHNDISGSDTVEMSFKADEELKILFNISSDEPFGHDGLIEISDDLNPKVTKKLRGEVEINVIDGIEPKPVDDFVVEFKKRPQRDGIFISTVYPGFPGPFFPNRLNQNEEEYQRSKEYWDRHAFIKF